MALSYAQEVLIDIIRVFIILIHLLSYSFNFVLLHLVINKRVLKTKVYMMNMITAELILNICQHLVIEPSWFFDDVNFKTLGIFSFIYMTATQFRFLLTFLMSINRFVVVLSPEKNVFFSQDHLTYYSYSIWGITTLFNMVYFINDCHYILTPLNYLWSIDCYQWKTSHYLEKTYYVLILTCIFNIFVVIYVKLRRLCNASTAPRISRTSAENRRTKENIFVMQAVVIMIIMAIDGAYNVIRKNNQEFFAETPIVLQYLIGSSIVYSSSLVNFLIYFVFHALIRKHVLNFVFRRPRYVPNPRIFVHSVSI